MTERLRAIEAGMAGRDTAMAELRSQVEAAETEARTARASVAILTGELERARAAMDADRTTRDAAAEARIDELEGRIAALEARLAEVERPPEPAPEPTPPLAEAPPEEAPRLPGAEELDRALDLADQAFRRFFGMVEDLKRDYDEQRI
ncbi:hypothetical protein [Methylobrevis pamukkalensis]|uniref:Chromosome partition protein Smc n=1 Tax=Methylobrevis pamukkalensis TaxID=1439726 RepID=A0A1E3H864_9HYPH|nr:hypothetical protein [Methylobrevis pamukkalensis]ODN72335.1 hypothetical protein A6302_00262 [Methylobrevis pamukkalensis]